MLSGPLVRATAPAKLNLGLAIVGRRPDGFHELCSVFQTISLCDRLILRSGRSGGDDLSVTMSELTTDGSGVAIDDPGLAEDDNLAIRALRLALHGSGAKGEFALSLRKGIPAASGLGGASADAAAALLMAEAVTGVTLHPNRRLALAAELGSDVPFCLTGGTALVGGRGERIEPLPAISPTNVIVIFPKLAMPIPRKTARLFAALRPEDFDPGDDVRQQVARIWNGLPLDPALLGNGFSRPLLGLAPELADLRRTVMAATGRAPALSGAGPTHYIVEPDEERAARSTAELRRQLGKRALVFHCWPWPGPPLVEPVRLPER